MVLAAPRKDSGREGDLQARHDEIPGLRVHKEVVEDAMRIRRRLLDRFKATSG
jgi:hypothetical protein